MFDAFFTLFRALNTSRATWQLSLAFALGVIPGLLPTLSLFNLIFLFLALFINLNLSIFLLSVALFSLIGFFLDPVLAMVGQAVLEAHTLQSLFTGWYQSGLMHLSDYYHTAVMGGLIVGGVLSPFVFGIAHLLFGKFRHVIPELRKVSALRFLLPISEAKAGEGKRLMPLRFWGIGIFGTLVLGGYIVVSMLLDGWLKSTLETQLANQGIETKISHLSTSLTKGHIHLKGVRCATDESGFSINDIGIEMDMNGLLMGYYHIKNLTMVGVKPTDERVKKPLTSQESAATSHKKAESGYQFPNVEMLLKVSPPPSLQQLEALKTHAQTVGPKWEKEYQYLQSNPYRDYERRLNELLKRAKKTKDLQEALQIAKEADVLSKEIEKEYKRLKTRSVEFEKEYHTLKRGMEAVPRQAKVDYETLKARYTPDQTGALNVTGALLGSEVKGYLESAFVWYERLLPYYERLAPYLKSEEVSYETQEREAGRIVRYPLQTPMPKVWIEQIHLEAQSEGGAFDLQVRDLSSDFNKPIYSTLLGVFKGIEAMQAKWVHHKDERFEIKVDAWKPASIESGGVRLDDPMGNVRLEGRIDEGIVNANGRVLFDKSRFVYTGKGDEAPWIQKTLEGIQHFTVDLSLKGEVLTPHIDLRSDLDRQLSKAFKGALKNAQADFERALKKGLQGRVNNALKGVGATNAQMQSVQKLLDRKGGGLASIQGEIKKQLSEKALKKQAEKALAKKMKKEGKKLEEQFKKELGKLF